MLCDHYGDCYELLMDVRVLNQLASSAPQGVKASQRGLCERELRGNVATASQG